MRSLSLFEQVVSRKPRYAGSVAGKGTLVRTAMRGLLRRSSGDAEIDISYEW